MARYIDAEKLKCSIDSETDRVFDMKNNQLSLLDIEEAKE